jgi:hypothetical protein
MLVQSHLTPLYCTLSKDFTRSGPEADIDTSNGDGANATESGRRRLLNRSPAGPADSQLIGEPAEPPRIAPASGPPEWDEGLASAVEDWDALVQPEPEYVFDQQVQW